MGFLVFKGWPAVDVDELEAVVRGASRLFFRVFISTPYEGVEIYGDGLYRVDFIN